MRAWEYPEWLRTPHDEQTARSLLRPRTGNVTVMAAKEAPAPVQVAGGASHKE